MRRRRYLSALGAAALGSTAGCSTVETELRNRRAALDFSFPPGISVNGVEDPTRLVAGHLAQLQSMTYTSEFIDRSSNYFNDGEQGTIRSSGTPEYNRWEIDHRLSHHAVLYRGLGVEYSEKTPSRDRQTELFVGDVFQDVSQAVIDSVGTRYRDALEVPFGSGSLEIQKGETDIAVFIVNSPTDRWVDSVDTMELAVDENGLIRRFDAVYTAIRQNPAESTYEREYHYSLDIGAEPPDDLSGIPDRAQTFPTFGVEWRDGGRVLEVTNTGGGPVAEDGRAAFFVEGLSKEGDIPTEAPFTPGETRYLFDRGGLMFENSPPTDTSTVLRTDNAPVFRYRNTWDSPIRLMYSANCDRFDCS